ncbi:TrbG/VirB9 family P-type conjugative transfer protein [Massilia sp. CFBP9012]|uniref:TrbG/VirB9 family P-type conjugative transfer protein n=1 Tax=Massilia sp. CFBP9012 TaxID=3096531 RepID=UPI002A6AF27E|nr:TrbG/VirB9 family P-type conjugative transfer protein [Massilia sp. CFBP9012]MDY0977695.1 TrbG/VirB9 family P-type conjugative transfer protein [Massilia sp. CFBP9012]
MKKAFMTAVVALALATNAGGAQLPEAGNKDARIRFATYDPYDVVTIHTRVGLLTQIVLDQDEEIVDMTGGDVEGWGVATKQARNGVFLKPAAELADANLHVVTNKRSYSFDLKMARKSKGEIGFMTVYFRYPEAEKPKQAAASETDQVRRLLDAAIPAGNRRYTVQGSSDLAPIEAWDDGRTTFLRFRARSTIPAIYEASEEGTPARIENINVEDDVVQVQGIRRKLVLQSGKRVTCVFNESFDPDAARPATNTASPQVKRTLKGAGK